jgi:hypothetical protein
MGEEREFRSRLEEVMEAEELSGFLYAANLLICPDEGGVQKWPRGGIVYPRLLSWSHLIASVSRPTGQGHLI